LARFPLFAGKVSRPSQDGDGWKIDLVDQPIPLEIVHSHSSHSLPNEGVMQIGWKWTPSLDLKAPRIGLHPHLLCKMRVTLLEDLGWSVIGLIHSHVVGAFSG
jgi:hypothetical protein